MTRNKQHPYVCIRCGFATQRKDSMRRHLYTLKNPCPGQEVNIEITDDIKECIIVNRVYKPPQDLNQSSITVTHIHQLNNVISESDLEKCFF